MLNFLLLLSDHTCAPPSLNLPMMKAFRLFIHGDIVNGWSFAFKTNTGDIDNNNSSKKSIPSGKKLSKKGINVAVVWEYIAILMVLFLCNSFGYFCSASSLSFSTFQDDEWYSVNQFMAMAARQKHFVLGVKQINNSLWNPSMIINPHNESQVLVVWRIVSLKREDRTGYFLLDFHSFINNVNKTSAGGKIGKLAKLM